MKLVKVKLTDVLSFQEFEFDVKGQITEFAGENGEGKSACLDSIRASLGSGNWGKLIRKGANKAQIVLYFDTGHILTTKITKKETERTVTIDGAKVMRVQEWIKSKLNPASFNPVTFVNADAAKRTEMLLEIAPLSLAYDDLLTAVGEEWVPPEYRGNGAFAFEDPLTLIDRIDKAIFDHRTGLNRSIRDKDGQISELKGSLPPENNDPIDPDGIETKLKSQKEEHKARLEAIDKAYHDARIKIDATARAAEIAENTRHEKELKRIADEKTTKLQECVATKDRANELCNEECRPGIEALKEKQGAVKARQEQAKSTEKTKQFIAKVENERAAHNDEAINNSLALDNLRKLRSRLLETLPVEGLTLDNGILAYNGIPYETLNEAGKVDVAMKIAAAGAGELKIITMDGLEKMSKKSRALFVKWAAKTEGQFFYCLVKDDEPLQVNDVPTPPEERQRSYDSYHGPDPFNKPESDVW